jgi:hypothetical protein
MGSRDHSTDTGSIAAVTAAIYDSLSFAPGGEPDWRRFEALFHPDGRLAPPSGPGAERSPLLDLATFQERSRAYIGEVGLRARGFHERELGRRTERFGRVAHVMSGYESLYQPGDAEPFARGVNSIQLLHEQDRWWVLSIAWDVEGPERPIPAEYLTGG